ncbi:MAG: hypothetical protein GFH27_549279n248 [Chloroflexi bacterium AL-W]|nr:hypothetical protein [Chloroflexi bacterium AL-N1]NOK65214.1 hypothetical protein [Chloroflexi bacterium AL-N10]NOK72521.1 hypothetical protein [Chloroflexi bacterium AL-N5]NOK79393.1 hypothetical protein [Chloroflexi bacterium AL-W]NOK87309.1 hypothetical protein [Chloroflexi bacterium AL-N15]
MFRFSTISLILCVTLVSACRGMEPQADLEQSTPVPPPTQDRLLTPTVQSHPTVSTDAAQSQIEIAVDPRTELIAIVQLLSGVDQMRVLDNSNYYRAVQDHFAAYDQHPVVTLFRDMNEAGFGFDAPFNLAIYLTDLPDMTLTQPLPEELLWRAGGSEQIEQFIEQLRDFADVTDFMGFFASQSAVYQDAVTIIETTLQDTDMVATLEAYYGMPQQSYSIVTTLLFTGRGYGIRSSSTVDGYDTFVILTPHSATSRGFAFGNQPSLESHLWHEFSHSFVNPLSEIYVDKLLESQMLGAPIDQQMRNMNYGIWLAVVNEHVVRAITTRLAYQEQGQIMGDSEREIHKSRGFIYLDAILEQLALYETSRTQYPTFADFYPQIVATFDALALDYLGGEAYLSDRTVNDVLDEAQAVTIVAPTNEDDAATQAALSDFIENYRDWFYPDAPILDDQTALQQDLSDQTLIVFGTLEGNRWLATDRDRFPFRFEGNSVIADQRYTGVNLRLITTWPHPQNPAKGMLIFTAQRAEDIIDINTVHFGSTDYLIAKGADNYAIHAGNYWKEGDVWSYGPISE